MTEQLQKKVDFAINLIQKASKVAAENGCPEIEVAYSCGKDSDVILELTKMAGVPYRAIYKNTTIDPKGTMKHAREKGVEIWNPKESFYTLIKKHGFPNRLRRHCCSALKEYHILDYVILGVRKNESNARRSRYNEPEQCRVWNKKTKARQYFPILYWEKEDVEEFIKERGIQCHPLYYDEQGNFHVERRLGCVGCPMMRWKKRIEDLKEHPQILKMYIRGGSQFLENHANSKVLNKFKDVYEMLCMELFCESMTYAEFEKKFGKTLFDDGVDCKKYIEDYFNVHV